MKRILAAFCILALSACATPNGQNQYSATDVGQSTLVEFGTIINVREVGITGKSSGAGALAGGALGGAAASNMGNGNGQAVAVVGGVIIGAIAGAAAEQAAIDSKGIEYTIIKENAQTVTIVQNQNKDDRVLQKGERVIVQISGSYQRVLPASELPEQIKRPKGIKVTD